MIIAVDRVNSISSESVPEIADQEANQNKTSLILGKQVKLVKEGK